jgi:hypothetical protein
MAYHSFGGEVEASNTPTIRRPYPFMPSPTSAHSSDESDGCPFCASFTASIAEPPEVVTSSRMTTFRPSIDRPSMSFIVPCALAASHASKSWPGLLLNAETRCLLQRNLEVLCHSSDGSPSPSHSPPKDSRSPACPRAGLLLFWLGLPWHALKRLGALEPNQQGYQKDAEHRAANN